MKQIVSMDSTFSFRPQSMTLDYPGIGGKNKAAASTDEITLRISEQNGNINRTRSQSNQNLASLGFSFAAQPHTCSGSVAPTTSQLQVSPAAISSGLSLSCTSSGRPTLIRQFSQASPCTADSPSPVEKDGVLPSSSSYKNKSHSSQKMTSVEVQYTTEAEPSAAKQFPGTEVAPKAKGSCSRRGLKDKQYLDASLHSNAPFRTKAAPNHSHSNPEFPLLTHIAMAQTERTHSYDDLYGKRRRPPFHVQAEDNEVSPSREKINHLSSQIYSSLDQNWAATFSSYATGSYHHHLLHDGCVGSESNPVCEVMQKIIQVTTPVLHLNRAHILTLMSSACSTVPVDHQSLSSWDSTETDQVYDSPITHLLSMGYTLVDKPLTVSFGMPCEGYMTLTFELMNQSTENADVLKVMM